MANQWGNRIIKLDSANSDSAYDPQHDAKEGGSYYSTIKYKINKIIVNGNAGNRIVIKECKPSCVQGQTILDVTLSEGIFVLDLHDNVYHGINPIQIDSPAVVYVHIV